MSKEKKNEPVAAGLPGWVKRTPELLPVWDWWVKDGRSTVTILLVAAICVAGWFTFRNWRSNRTTAASNALMNAFSADELEEAVAKFASSPSGPALRLRLGKSYLDAERWEEAEATYSGYIAEAKKDDPFAALAELGRAYALEGGRKYDEAKVVYESLSADTNLPVHATAALGVARCVALKGDKDGAIKLLEGSDDVRAKNLIETIRRFDPNRKTASLFDAADSAADKIAQETPAAAKPADMKPKAKEEGEAKKTANADPAKPAAEKAGK